MADTILGGDFTITYLDENREKSITWSGSASGTRTVNELYSALQDHFDEVARMDDTSPMSAETPTEYTVGKIDPGDSDPYYITYETMEHLTGGAVKTSGWARVQDSNIGIVVCAVTSNNNDIILIDGDSTVVETAMVTISKNRVHTFGVNGALGHYGHGAKISVGVTTSATDIATIKNTGVRNTFTGIKVINENTVAEGLYAWAEGGEFLRSAQLFLDFEQ